MGATCHGLRTTYAYLYNTMSGQQICIVACHLFKIPRKKLFKVENIYELQGVCPC